MAKNVPPELAAHILPFDWDVRRVWALDADVVVEPMSAFAYLLDLPLWSSRPYSGMLFDLTPMTVIGNPAVAPHQAERINQAEIAYPLEFLLLEGRPWLLDGVHRLAKLYALGVDTIQVRYHSASVIPRIRIDRG